MQTKILKIKRQPAAVHYKDFHTSRKRIQILSESPKYLQTINSLIKNTGAVVTADDIRRPDPPKNTKEFELRNFLPHAFDEKLGKDIESFWLASVTKNTKTPEWDLISTCTLNGKKGILLVEAKAHRLEIEIERKPEKIALDFGKNFEKKKQNFIHINEDLNKSFPGIDLSVEKCSQMSHHIAHAWWLASRGIPVVLLYLGFLNADEKKRRSKRNYHSDEDWYQSFFSAAKVIGADKMIDKRIDCGESSFTFITGSLDGFLRRAKGYLKKRKRGLRPSDFRNGKIKSKKTFKLNNAVVVGPEKKERSRPKWKRSRKNKKKNINNMKVHLPLAIRLTQKYDRDILNYIPENKVLPPVSKAE